MCVCDIMQIKQGVVVKTSVPGKSLYCGEKLGHGYFDCIALEIDVQRIIR